MATKAENIVILQQLAEKLGRDVDITGTAAEIAQRVAEWREEVDGQPDAINETAPAVGSDNGDNAGGTKPDTTDAVSAGDSSDETPQDDGLALVTMLKTAHLSGAYDVSGTKKIDIGVAGQMVRIPGGLIDTLRRDKLIN